MSLNEVVEGMHTKANSNMKLRQIDKGPSLGYCVSSGMREP